MAMININGKELYYEEYGEKTNPCLIVLHGGPGAACIDFRRTARALSDKLYVILLDQFGCGRSGAFPEGSEEVFGMPQHLAQIEAFRKELGIEQWILLGHSYGGMLAALYAHDYPDAVKAVIYECPSWNFMESGKSIAQYYINRHFKFTGNKLGLELAKRLINTDYTGIESQSIQDVLGLQPHVTDMPTLFYIHGTTIDDFLLDYTELQLDERAMDAAAYVHMMKISEEGSMYRDYLPLIAENKQPALLLEGVYDPACTMYQQIYFINNAPDGRIKHFDNCGHMPHVEAKEEFYAEIKKFTAEITK